MAVPDKLKGMVEELRRDLNEVKDRQSRGRRIAIGTDDT